MSIVPKNAKLAPFWYKYSADLLDIFVMFLLVQDIILILIGSLYVYFVSDWILVIFKTILF